MTASEHKGLPILSFPSLADWLAWLSANGGQSKGLWIKFAKKGSGVPCLGKPAAIEGALVHGWVDGQLDKFDETAWLVRFTPRGARSKWSQINREAATRLIDEGRMAPAGLAEVERAKADGRWDAAYAAQSRAEVPPDLAAAFEANPKAKAFFAALTGPNRFAVLYRIHDAKTEKTRVARIEKFVGMLERGEVVYPDRTPKRPRG